MKYENRIQQATATTGTGVVTLGAADSGFQAIQDKYADGDTVPYTLIDGNEWETGQGTFNTPNQLSRDTIEESTNLNNPINLSGSAKVLGDASAGLINSLLADTTNVIIGGDFTTNPWQRGTSFTDPTTISYLADRFLTGYSDDAAVNILQTADAPTAAEAGVYTAHCLHADVTTADASIAAGQFRHLVQYIEGLNVARFGFGQSGTRYVTLSFWHKHTKTGTHCIALVNAISDRSYVAEYTQSVSDTWEKAEITIPVDTSGSWLYDTRIGLRVYFTLASGSNYHTTAGSWAAGNYIGSPNQVNNLDSIANNFKIALVQLEEGEVATPFEYRSVGEELALCQRYYEKSYQQGTAPGTATTAGQVLSWCSSNNNKWTTHFTYPFMTRKRASPTVTLYSPNSGLPGTLYNNTTASDINQNVNASESHMLVGFASFQTSSDQIQWHYTIDAEL